MPWLAALGCVALAAESKAGPAAWPPDVTQPEPGDRGWNIFTAAQIQEKLQAKIRELSVGAGTTAEQFYQGPDKAPLDDAQRDQVVKLVAKLMVDMRGTMLKELTGQIALHGPQAVAAASHAEEVQEDGLPPVVPEQELESKSRDQTIADSLRSTATTLNKTHEVSVSEAVERESARKRKETADAERKKALEEAAQESAEEEASSLAELGEAPADGANPSGVKKVETRPFAKELEARLNAMKRPAPPTPPLWEVPEDMAWIKEVKASVLAEATTDWTALLDAATDPNQQSGRQVERVRLRLASAAHRMAEEKLADPTKFIEPEHLAAYDAALKAADAAFAARSSPAPAPDEVDAGVAAAAETEAAVADEQEVAAAADAAAAAVHAEAPAPEALPETAAEPGGVKGTLLEFATHLRRAADAAWQRL